MAGYTLTAQTLDQRESSSRFMVVVSVFDSNGSAIPHLNEHNFSVHHLSGEAHFSVAEVQSAGQAGFYRLFLSTEPGVPVGECILALQVAGHRQVSGRVPGHLDEGVVMVKIKAG